MLSKNLYNSSHLLFDVSTGSNRSKVFNTRAVMDKCGENKHNFFTDAECDP